MVKIFANCYSDAFAQNVVPPSPTASGFAQYAEFPISYYSGIPNITIPLYEIDVDGFKLPINLTYHSSGIKVEQEASNVGLGWTLNAGGVISRVIRDGDDFDGSSEIGYPDVPAFADYSWTSIFDVLGTCNYGGNSTLCHQNYDTEPDIFYYNFGGNSGKFVLNKRISGEPITVQPLTPTAISFTYIHGDWVLVDDRGIKYYFTEKETTELYSKNFQSVQTDISPTNDLNLAQQATPTAWYLSKIELPIGDEILIYRSKGLRKIYSPTRLNYEKSNPVELVRDIAHTKPTLAQKVINYLLGAVGLLSSSIDNFLSVECNFNLSLDNYTYSCSITDDIQIDSITYSQGCIEFTHSSRKDIRHSNFEAPHKVDAIKIKSRDNKVLKTFDLSYSYFREDMLGDQDEWKYLRLKLDSVTTISEQERLPAYIFDYYDDYTYKLPSKNSFAKDLWGYYNGENINDNSVFYGVPELTLYELPSLGDNLNFSQVDSDVINYFETVTYNTLVKAYRGDNREVNSTLCKTGVLNRITYPLGNTRTLYFEPNEYSNFEPEDEVVEVSGSACACSGNNCICNTGIKEDVITINANIATDLSISCHFFLLNSSTPISPGSVDFGSLIIEKPSGEYENLIGWGKSVGAEWVIDAKYPLEEIGDYKLIITSHNGYQGIVNTKHKRKTGGYVYIKQGGGIRISKIIDSENATKDLYFSYKDSIFHNEDFQSSSSGKLLTNPIGPSWRVQYGTCANTENQSFLLISLLRSSVPLAPLLSTNNGIAVGYSTVKVSSSLSSDENGYNEYTYINEEESPYIIGSTPQEQKVYSSPLMPNTAKLDNGLLMRTISTDKSGKIIEETINEWKLDSSFYGSSIGLRFLPGGSYGFYGTNFQWWKNTSSITYYNEELKDTAFYLYSLVNFKLKQESSRDSKNNLRRKYYHYPFDYVGIPELESLQAKNITGKPVDTRSYLNNRLVSGTQVKYNDKGQVVDVYNFEINDEDIPFASNTPYTFTHKFNYAYNSESRRKHEQKENDLSTYYLWGYNDQYPVAEIVSNNSGLTIDAFQVAVREIDFSGVDSKLSVDDDISSLKGTLGSILTDPNYQVTLYTYKPLVGMTSSTDASGRTTYYEYDDFGRLEFVRDHKGNLVNQYNYHYAGQQ